MDERRIWSSLGRDRRRANHGRRSSLLRAALLLGSAAAVAGALDGTPAAAATPSPTPAPPPAAISNEAVTSIAVSPAFAKTGFATAVSAPVASCKTDCVHLWVTYDGGNTWQRSPASGWNNGAPKILLDGQGNEVLITAAPKGYLVSRDEGDTWTTVGADTGVTGAPTARPNFGQDQSVAFAGQQDSLLVGSHAQAIKGSGGAYRDMSFQFMPSWPQGGSRSALLVAYDTGKNVPVIQQCDQSLSCSGNGVLPNAGTYAFPITLWPSKDFTSDGVVFAQTGNFVFKSVDGGQSFAPLAIGENGAMNTATPQMALAPGFSDAGPVRTAYVAVFQIFQDTSTKPPKPRTSGGIYQTTDAGATWHVYGPGTQLDSGAMSVAISPSGRLFAGAVTHGEGLLCNDGSGWHASCSVVGNNPRRFAKPRSAAAGSTPASGCTGASCPGSAGASAAPVGTGANPTSAPDSGAANGIGEANTRAAVAKSSAGLSPAVPIAASLAALTLLVLIARRLTSRRSAATGDNAPRPRKG